MADGERKNRRRRDVTFRLDYVTEGWKGSTLKVSRRFGIMRRLSALEKVWEPLAVGMALAKPWGPILGLFLNFWWMFWFFLKSFRILGWFFIVSVSVRIFYESSDFVSVNEIEICPLYYTHFFVLWDTLTLIMEIHSTCLKLFINIPLIINLMIFHQNNSWNYIHLLKRSYVTI